jgi:hypothetical protein
MGSERRTGPLCVCVKGSLMVSVSVAILRGPLGGRSKSFNG